MYYSNQRFLIILSGLNSPDFYLRTTGGLVVLIPTDIKNSRKKTYDRNHRSKYYNKVLIYPLPELNMSSEVSEAKDQRRINLRLRTYTHSSLNTLIKSDKTRGEGSIYCNVRIY